MHFTADAVELIFHWLNSAGSQAKLFEQRCNFSFVSAYSLQCGFGFVLVVVLESFLKQILVDFEQFIYGPDVLRESRFFLRFGVFLGGGAL